MDIQDVLNELEIIKQIAEQKFKVWAELHNNPPVDRKESHKCDAAQIKRCSWGIENCNPSSIRGSSYGYLNKIQKSAEVVHKKV